MKRKITVGLITFLLILIGLLLYAGYSISSLPTPVDMKPERMNIPSFSVFGSSTFLKSELGQTAGEKNQELLFVLSGVWGVAFFGWSSVKTRQRILPRRNLGISQRQRIHLSSSGRTLTQPREAPYWQSHGWERDNGMYIGRYNQRYPGAVRVYGNDLEFFVTKLPRGIKKQRHPHSICFTKENGMFHIHFERRPSDLNAGILAVENILKEAENY